MFASLRSGRAGRREHHPGIDPLTSHGATRVFGESFSWRSSLRLGPVVVVPTVTMVQVVTVGVVGSNLDASANPYNRYKPMLLPQAKVGWDNLACTH